MLDEASGPIAGATNAGLEEPGRNCAIYAALWLPLILPKRGGLDRTIELATAVEVRDRTLEHFVKAASQLQSEHNAVQRALKRQFPDNSPQLIWG